MVGSGNTGTNTNMNELCLGCNGELTVMKKKSMQEQIISSSTFRKGDKSETFMDSFIYLGVVIGLGAVVIAMLYFGSSLIETAELAQA